jgi:hypothetical protein
LSLSSNARQDTMQRQSKRSRISKNLRHNNIARPPLRTEKCLPFARACNESDNATTDEAENSMSTFSITRSSNYAVKLAAKSIPRAPLQPLDTNRLNSGRSVNNDIKGIGIHRKY